ncbi:MAG: bifunctional adenosylcobinamide kinase/adenosylcobinamide-phosphate guanylyltransferase [Angelakisella sp.]|jgi:adenosylcobinamide kinase/adenosylcobinamide-phosphate guanylyltransferase|nr:bifunctional adenosylcobinamide kinase/adenosylcobinamide-phosphate guanylyltransferase [Angelakisella sp.]
MTVYLEGGNACGKSRLGEEWAVFLHRGSPGPLLYLATMAAGDRESLRRVARHRAARAGKGFETIERPKALAGLELPPGATVLLEDLGNLSANELFGGGGEAALTGGLEHLFSRARHLVIIGNSVFEEGPSLTGELEGYLRALSKAQALCAARANAAAEVLCGIPLWHKPPEEHPPAERRPLCP